MSNIDGPTGTDDGSQEHFPDSLDAYIKRDAGVIDQGLGSAALIEARQHIEADGDFITVIEPLPDSETGMSLYDGVIHLDAETYEHELTSVTDWLVNGITTGDEQVLSVYLRNIIGDSNEEEELRQQLRDAFAAKDASKLTLDELKVSIVTAGIAERNMIRNGLRPEIERLPFYFKDENGVLLTGESDLDIIISKVTTYSDTFKLIIGSKRGIGTIHIPEKLSTKQFKPSDKITKEGIRNVISIPINTAADKTKPSIELVEVYLGPVDASNALEQQEKEEKAKEVRAAARAEKQKQAAYNPPAPKPSPGRWTSYSG